MRRDSRQRRTFLNYENSIRQSCYRPFVKQWLYYNFVLISNTYQIPKIFPNNAKVNIRENNKLDHATPYSTHDSPLTTLRDKSSNNSYRQDKRRIYNIDDEYNTRFINNFTLTILPNKGDANMNNLSLVCPDKTKGEFFTFITNMLPDFHILETSQIFPIEVVQT